MTFEIDKIYCIFILFYSSIVNDSKPCKKFVRNSNSKVLYGVKLFSYLIKSHLSRYKAIDPSMKQFICVCHSQTSCQLVPLYLIEL